MSDPVLNRRGFLLSAAVGAAGLSLGGMAEASAAARQHDLPPPVKPDRGPLPVMAVRQVQTDTLDIGYHETGPENGRPVILLHGFPYDYPQLRRGGADAGGTGLSRDRAAPAWSRHYALPGRGGATLRPAGRPSGRT
jgi:hypothetical protein